MALQSRDDLIADLQSKTFRDAFVSSRVSNTLALQIRAMREERGWSQAHLAKLLGTSQNAVYRLEGPQYGRYNVTTLKRLASIFDVGLAVWFVPFSKLVDRVTNLSTEDILVPSFENDPGFQEEIADSAVREYGNTDSGVTPGDLIFTFGIGSQTIDHLRADDLPKIPPMGGQFEIRFPPEGMAPKPHVPASCRVPLVEQDEIPSQSSVIARGNVGGELNDEGRVA